MRFPLSFTDGICEIDLTPYLNDGESYTQFISVTSVNKYTIGATLNTDGLATLTAYDVTSGYGASVSLYVYITVLTYIN